MAAINRTLLPPMLHTVSLPTYQRLGTPLAILRTSDTRRISQADTNAATLVWYRDIWRRIH
jgi:hypothetical protein